MLQRIRPRRDLGHGYLRPTTARLVTGAELTRIARWPHSFGDQRKDRRYYELVESSVAPQFTYRYLVLEDGRGNPCAVQPCFVIDQDLLDGQPAIRAIARLIRRVAPRFLYIRTLMVGCAAGEGHLDLGGTTPTDLAAVLSSHLDRCAAALGARLIVLKEFPATCRPALAQLCGAGYTRIPSLPMAKLCIDYANFDDYLRRALSRHARQQLRRDLRAAEGSLELEVIRDVTPIIDDVYPLYLNVYERAQLRFEKLTREFFCQIGQRMPDKVRFFVWRRHGRIVACSLCLVQADTIFAEYLGLDYALGRDLHLYQHAFKDVVSWAIARGYKWFCSTGGHYDPKLHWRCSLVPLDLYVRHRSMLANAMLARLLPLLTPVRHDPILQRFPNYQELWQTPGEVAKR